MNEAEALAANYAPLLTIDFSALPALTIGGAGAYVMGGATWWAKGAKNSNHPASAVVPGEGLRFTVAGSLGYQPGNDLPGGMWNTQVLALPLASLPGFDPEKPILVEAQLYRTTPQDGGLASIAFGIATAEPNGNAIPAAQRASQMYWGSTGETGAALALSSGSAWNPVVTTAQSSPVLANHAYALLKSTARAALGMHGAWGGDFPALGALTDRVALTSAADASPAALVVLLNSQTTWAGGIRRLRISQPVVDHDPRTLARLRDAALALLPPGRAFSRRLDSMIARVLEALSIEFARVHLGAGVLMANVSPRRVRDPNLLAAWEEAAGITRPTGDLAERAQAVADRIRGARPFNLAAYQAIALEHGYTLPGALKVEVQFFRAGQGRAGQPAPGTPWAFALVGQVNGPDVASALNALTASWAARVKRAHTLVRARVGGEQTFYFFGVDEVVVNDDKVVQ